MLERRAEPNQERLGAVTGGSSATLRVPGLHPLTPVTMFDRDATSYRAVHIATTKEKKRERRRSQLRKGGTCS